jgi:CRP-like cAMP-binding protein
VKRLDRLKAFFVDKQFVRKRDFLRSLSLFSGLSNRELGSLLQMFHSRVYQEGEIVFQEGDIGRALFVVESGKVALTRRTQDGKDRAVAELGPGSFFGEMALLEQLPRSAAAVAKEKSALLLLYRSKLDEILRQHPHIGVSIMMHLAQLLSARLRRANQSVPAAIAAESAEQTPA